MLRKVRPLQLHALLQARQYVRAFEAKKLAEERRSFAMVAQGDTQLHTMPVRSQEILKNAPGTPSPKVPVTRVVTCRNK